MACSDRRSWRRSPEGSCGSTLDSYTEFVQSCLLYNSVKMLHNLAMETENKQLIYDAAGGLDGLLRLAHAWHTRVLEDEVVSHAFSHGYHPEHTERLAAYWAEALGGPPMSSDQFGNESSVVRLHSGHGI